MRTQSTSAFTMMEIAISLAIIGIALVAIIGVLPIGMNAQQDNRQETIIGQDASTFIGDIQNGVKADDSLTNYVYAITNYWFNFTDGTHGINGYTYSSASVSSPVFQATPLTNGFNIVGLMSTPEFIGGPSDTADSPGFPLASVVFGGR